MHFVRPSRWLWLAVLALVIVIYIRYNVSWTRAKKRIINPSSDVTVIKKIGSSTFDHISSLNHSKTQKLVGKNLAKDDWTMKDIIRSCKLIGVSKEEVTRTKYRNCMNKLLELFSDGGNGKELDLKEGIVSYFAIDTTNK